MTDEDQPEENIEMAKETQLRAVSPIPPMMGEDRHEEGPAADPNAIERALSTMHVDLRGIDTARNAVEQHGIQYHNQTQQLLIENEDRVIETDRAISAEDELVAMCNKAIAELQATVKAHGDNLALLRIERQGRLDMIHFLKSNNIA